MTTSDEALGKKEMTISDEEGDKIRERLDVIRHEGKAEHGLGKKGHLLYDFVEDKYFFREYTSEDKKCFVDYELRVEDIMIEITDRWVIMRQSKTGNVIDWETEKERVLRRNSS